MFVKKTLWIVIAAIVLVAVLLISSYNGLVSSRAQIDESFANIDAQLQRRSDLIPNLVETVKGITNQEKAIVDAVTSARENYLNAGSDNEKIAASNELSAALSNLLVVVENYPEITSGQNFIALQDELAGTENRIAQARKSYNEAVKNYNPSIRKFPRNILAGMFGFEPAQYFETSEENKTVPKVEF